jgi:hypothetical protein
VKDPEIFAFRTNSEAPLLLSAVLSSPITAAKAIKNEAELEGISFEGLSSLIYSWAVLKTSWSHVTSKINF